MFDTDGNKNDMFKKSGDDMFGERKNDAFNSTPKDVFSKDVTENPGSSGPGPTDFKAAEFGEDMLNEANDQKQSGSDGYGNMFKEDKSDNILSTRENEDMLSNSKDALLKHNKDELLSSGQEFANAAINQFKETEAEGETVSQIVKNYEEAEKQKAANTAEAAVKVVGAIAITAVTAGAGAGVAAAEVGAGGAGAAEAGAASAEAANTAQNAEATAAMAKDITAEELSKQEAESAARAAQKADEDAKAKRLFNKTRKITKTGDKALEKMQTKQAREIVKGELRKESLAQELSKETGVAMKKQAVGASLIAFLGAPFLAMFGVKAKMKIMPIIVGIVTVVLAVVLIVSIFAAVLGALRISLTMNLDSVPEDRTVQTLVRTLPQTWQAAATNQAQALVADYEERGEPVNLIFSVGAPHTFETVAIWYARRTYEAPEEASSGAWAGYISCDSDLEPADNTSWYHKSDDAYGGDFAIKALAENQDTDGLDEYNMPMSDLLALYSISQDLNFTLLNIEERTSTGGFVDGAWETSTAAYVTTVSEYLTVYDYYTDYDCSEEIQVFADKCMAGDDEGFNFLWKYLTRRAESPDSQFRYLMVDKAIWLWDAFGRRTISSRWSSSLASEMAELYNPVTYPEANHINALWTTIMRDYLDNGSSAFNTASLYENDTLSEIFGADNLAAFQVEMGPLPRGASWDRTTWNNYIARCSRSGGDPAWCAFFISGLANNGTKGYYTTDYTWYLNAGLNIDSIADAGYNDAEVSFNEMTAQSAGTWRSLTDEQFADACFSSNTWRSTYVNGFTYNFFGEKTLGIVDCGNNNYAILYKAGSDWLSSGITSLGINSISFNSSFFGNWVNYNTGATVAAPSWASSLTTVSVSTLQDQMPNVSDTTKDAWWAAVKTDAQNNDTSVMSAFPHNIFAMQGLYNSTDLAGLRISTNDYIVSLTTRDAPYADLGSTANLVEYMINDGRVNASPADPDTAYTIAFDPYSSGWDTDRIANTVMENLGVSINDDEYRAWLDGVPTYCLPDDISGAPYIVPPCYNNDAGGYTFDYANASFSEDGDYTSGATCNTSIIYNHRKGFYIPTFSEVESDSGYYWNVDNANSDEAFWQLCWALGQNYDASTTNIGYDLLAEIPQRSLEYFQFGQGGCTQMSRFYNSKGWLYDYMSPHDAFVPLPGDLILYKKTTDDGYSTSVYKHVGIVVATTEPDANGNYKILTIEGNTNNTIWLKVQTNTSLFNVEAGVSTASFVCLPY